MRISIHLEELLECSRAVKIISQEVERLLQNFQFTIRENNAQDINEATSELTSIFKHVRSEIKTHSKLSLVVR